MLFAPPLVQAVNIVKVLQALDQIRELLKASGLICMFLAQKASLLLSVALGPQPARPCEMRAQQLATRARIVPLPQIRHLLRRPGTHSALWIT